MAYLKRPWPFGDDQQNSSLLSGAENFSAQLNTDQIWEWSAFSSGNIFPGLDNANQHEYFQAHDSHVTNSPPSASVPIAPPNPQETNEQFHQESREICFGSIIDVKAQLKNANIPHRGYSSAPNASFRCFEVVPEGDYYSLTYFGNKFAVLNKRTCRKLQTVHDGRQLRFQAYVQSKEWSAVVESWQKNKNSTILTGEINIYGTREDADQVGNILSNSGTFLQQPRYGLVGVAYYNPHYLRIPGFSDADSFDTPILPIGDAVVAPTQTLHEEEQSNPSIEVSSILDSLSHHDFLRERVADGRIRRPLLPHQKEAIDFIFRRETGQLPAALSLWRYDDTDSDQPFYQHIISGAKRSEQDEAKGGILADDMGLGKTLVILSTIAGSLDRAAEFVRADDQTAETQPQPTVPSRATLIIAPSSLLLESWIDEIRKHTYPGDLTFHKHHGQGRQADAHRLHSCDVVFTTYATVAAEFCRGVTTLFKVKWFRIVLDEGHDVRNRSTKQFQAVAGLSAQHRWCLTGTPIQNSLEDLGALVAFLKVPMLENAPTFRKYITNQSTSTSRDRFSSLRMLLGTICLRRTRELLHLPEPVPQIRKLCLTPSEQIEYNDILLECRKAIDMAVSGHRRARLSSTMLESLLKLRLFCNNGSSDRVVQIGPTGLPSDTDEALSYLEQNDQAVCAYCSGTIYSINDSRDTDGGTWIASCFHYIAFSSWKKTLTLISQLLTSRQIPFYCIDGSLSLSERGKVLHEFRSSTGANILLMTLGTGAVGLNLAVASRIYLLEPQWNPSIELQAIGRALRLGQTDQVTIVRYIMKNTVEESNVLSRQHTKLQLAGGGFAKGRGGISSERFQSLLGVFGVEGSA